MITKLKTYRINLWKTKISLTFEKTKRYYKARGKTGEMTQAISALQVAKYFIYKANCDGDLITNLKMQKLLYYAQAWYLVNFSKALFKDPIMAWRFGPIVESVYHDFKKFKYSPIKCENAEKAVETIPVDKKQYLDEYYKIYISYSAFDLTQMSHNEGPWRDTPQSKEISIKTIQNFYKEQYRKQVEKKAKKTT